MGIFSLAPPLEPKLRRVWTNGMDRFIFEQRYFILHRYFIYRLLNDVVDASTENDHDCSLIEEENEVPPTRSLLAGPTVLVPGKNTVNVKAMVSDMKRSVGGICVGFPAILLMHLSFEVAIFLYGIFHIICITMWKMQRSDNDLFLFWRAAA